MCATTQNDPPSGCNVPITGRYPQKSGGYASEGRDGLGDAELERGHVIGPRRSESNSAGQAIADRGAVAEIGRIKCRRKRSGAERQRGQGSISARRSREGLVQAKACASTVRRRGTKVIERSG